MIYMYVIGSDVELMVVLLTVLFFNSRRWAEGSSGVCRHLSHGTRCSDPGKMPFPACDHVALREGKLWTGLLSCWWLCVCVLYEGSYHLCLLSYSG